VNDMKLKSLIDPKKRERAMEALRKNKPELLRRKKEKPKAEPAVEEPTPQGSPDLEWTRVRIINAPMSNDQVLLKGAKEGNELSVMNALKAGAHVNATDAQLRTALIIAAKEISRLHKEKYPNPEAYLPYEHIIEGLLKKGADVALRDKDGKTAWDHLSGVPNAKWLAGSLKGPP
jgi:hypothetical protein